MTSTTTRLATAATWAERTLAAQDAQHEAEVAADAVLAQPDDPTDPWAGERRRALHQAKLLEAAAHQRYAEEAEAAGADATRHELTAEQGLVVVGGGAACPCGARAGWDGNVDAEWLDDWNTAHADCTPAGVTA